MKELAKICPNCGKQNKIVAKFCENCGNDLSDVKNMPQSKKESNTSEGIHGWWNKQGSGIKILSVIGLCCIGFMVIGLIGAMIFPNSHSTSNSTSTPSNAATVQSKSSELDGYEDFSNNFISFKYPPSLTIDDRSLSNMLNVFLDPSGVANTENSPVVIRLCDQGTTDQTSKELADSYIHDFQSESSAFKVIKKEDLTISGQPAILLEYKDTDPLSDDSNGPVYKYGVTFLVYNGHQYNFDIEPRNGNYASEQDFANYETIIKTVQLK